MLRALYALLLAPAHHIFSFNLRFLHEMKQNFCLAESVKGFSIFDSVLLLLYLCSTKSMDSLSLKCHNAFQNQNNTKATIGFAPKPLIFRLK